MAREKSKSKSESDNDSTQFRRLFWAARKELNYSRHRTVLQDADFRAALAFAKSRGWVWAEGLLNASKASVQNEKPEIQSLLQIENSVPNFWIGYYHFVRGGVLFAKSEYDESILAYRLAINDPHFDKPEFALNNIARSHLMKGEHDTAIRVCRKLLTDLNHDSAGQTWTNLGICLAAKGKHDEAIDAFGKALADSNNDTLENAWRGLGNSLAAKGKHDEAIKSYRTALTQLKYISVGQVWFEIGNSYSAKGEIEDAISSYRKAIADSNYKTPEFAWNNLGLMFISQGRYDDALSAYRAALSSPKPGSAGKIWNNLGNALAEKEKYAEAIGAYRNALDDPKHDSPGNVWNNLGKALAAHGDRDAAVKAYKKALSDPNAAYHARARLGLQLLNAKIASEALSADDRAMTGTRSSGADTVEIESEVITAIQAAGDTQYEKYVAKENSRRDDTLSILRGWSSAVTLLEGSERRWRGGGYFLKWRGCGIVIDPGFDFLRNFHDANYHGREVNAVIVSHNHPDHNSDLKAIDDLRYELFKRRTVTGESGIQPYVLLWDQDTAAATRFGIAKPQHLHEPVVLACGFPQPINLTNHEAKLPVRVTPFKVNHGADVPSAMGLIIELLDDSGNPSLKIGYTADTGYFEKLHKHLTGCDILIAHISQPSIEELTDASKLKEVHLGYRGTARLFKECNPKLGLIGEFWAGYTDLRIPLVKGVRQRSGINAILPAGLAMHIKLPSLDIECTECKKPTPFTQTKIAPPTDNFGSLAYLCPNCMIG